MGNYRGLISGNNRGSISGNNRGSMSGVDRTDIGGGSDRYRGVCLDDIGGS